MTFGDGILRRSRVALLLALLGLPAPASADELDITVRDDDGKPVESAVVYAIPLGDNGRPARIAGPVAIDQVDEEYVPYVTAVQVGTSVNFPNKDQIRHHVYSFSQVKKFEIPLYAGTPAKPVVFDKPGSVALGCNIHDWMKAYVFVTESPYFAVTQASGKATVELPPGDYAVEVWHPELKGDPASTSQRVSLTGAGSSLGFAIEQKRVWAPRRAPSSGGGGGYR
ncbi:MAG: methylamine utilization protein [Myxococcota bacterium]